MSAIAGIFRLDDRTVAPAPVEKMLFALKHRGPDKSQIWAKHSVGLGHNLLHVTPESLFEKYPALNDKASLVLTADVQLDNREELGELLGLSKHELEKMGDDRLILHCYEAWGEICVEKMVGDFSFVIYDQNKESLFCARDPVGAKPFYYCFARQKFFAFASEPKGLLCLEEIPLRINELMVASYLNSSFENKEITFYENILRLPPGCSATLSKQNGLQINSYWKPERLRELSFSNEDDYLEGFLHHLETAVRSRLRTAFPVGSMLSGGLDSSSVTTIANRLLGARDQRLHTFSAIFPDVPDCDERFFIDLILKQNSPAAESHYIRADQISPLENIEQTLIDLDGPFLLPNLFFHKAIYRLAKEKNVRTLLTGYDGDTVVSYGYAHLTELFKKGNYSAFLKELLPFWKYSRFNFFKILILYGFDPFLPSSILPHLRTFFGMIPPPHVLNPMINPQFAQKTGLLQILRTSKNEKRVSSSLTDSWEGIRQGLNAHSLETLERAGSYHQVQNRHPYFDKRMMEFCISLPGRMKIHQGWTRWIQHQALDKLLPKEICWRRRKTHFAANLFHTFLKYDGKRLKALFSSPPATAGKFFNTIVLKKEYNSFLNFQGASHWNIWKAATLLLWINLVERGDLYELKKG